MKVLRWFSFTLLFVAGCSVFPGLRVITGEDGANTTAQQSAEMINLVMADKTGTTDPSLMAAANRIEAASQNIDIIEIRKDEVNDVFVVNMLFVPPGQGGQADMLSVYTAIQRAMELTWQGTLAESEGTGAIQINFIAPQGVSTLDGGPSFVGFYYLNSEIERIDAINYLSGTRDLNNFLGLIVDGTLLYENLEGGQLYNGEPNHPLFMLDASSLTQN